MLSAGRIYAYQSCLSDGSFYLEIAHDGSLPDKLTRRPEKPGGHKHRVSPGQRDGALDPISAAMPMIALSGDVLCDRTAPVHDGKKRFDPDLSTTESSEDKVICEAAFRRVAGYSQKHIKKGSVYELYAWTCDGGCEASPG